MIGFIEGLIATILMAVLLALVLVGPSASGQGRRPSTKSKGAAMATFWRQLARFVRWGKKE